MNEHHQAFTQPEAWLAGRRLSADFDDLSRQTDRWWYIRQMYLDFMPDIIQTAREDVCRWAGVYPLDWSEYFSEPERLTWQSIRSRRVVLYPQTASFPHRSGAPFTESPNV